MALIGAKNWQEEIVRAMLTQKLGPEKAKALFGLNRPGTPAIIPSALDLASLWPDNPLNGNGIIPFFGGASNNWVVHGSRTDTGYPLLANDMHLDVTIPSVWYEIHLVGGDFDVIGLSLPGVPLVIAGHNKDVAWGITFAYTDTQDIFLERMNPDSPSQYLYKGKWEQARRIEEPIRVKGEESPVKHEVLETVHGPILSPQVSDAEGLGYAFSLKWCGHDPGGMISALSSMNLAGDLKKFKEAALKWPEPAMNLVCADRHGKIGYFLASRIPLRPQGHGRGPFPGWTGEHDWTGYLPANEKPFLLNPTKGFIVTANNRVAGDEYPHYLSDDYLSGYRAERIQEVLARKARVSKEDFSGLQGDFKCLQAARFMKALEGMEAHSSDARDLLTRLRSWDQVLSPESAEAAIYSVLFYRLMENTFRDEMGDLAARFFGLGLTELKAFSTLVTQSRVTLTNLLSEPDSHWFDDVTTPENEDLNHVLERSLDETASFLKQAMGPDPSDWRWGWLHQIEFQHPLGRVKPLNKIFNLGPFEGGGSFSTVWQSTFMPGMDFSYKGWTASNRHIYDLEDWDRSLGAIVPGQSGMLGSPHYSDQTELWLNVDHHPLYFSRVKVEGGTKKRLVLGPGGR
jgi:penicillin amidase